MLQVNCRLNSGHITGWFKWDFISPISHPPGYDGDVLLPSHVVWYYCSQCGINRLTLLSKQAEGVYCSLFILYALLFTGWINRLTWWSKQAEGGYCFLVMLYALQLTLWHKQAKFIVQTNWSLIKHMFEVWNKCVQVINTTCYAGPLRMS